MLSETGILVSTLGHHVQSVSFARHPIHGASPSWDQRIYTSGILSSPYSQSQVWCITINVSSQIRTESVKAKKIDLPVTSQ
jgi:hypothetical protein